MKDGESRDANEHEWLQVHALIPSDEPSGNRLPRKLGQQRTQQQQQQLHQRRWQQRQRYSGDSGDSNNSNNSNNSSSNSSSNIRSGGNSDSGTAATATRIMCSWSMQLVARGPRAGSPQRNHARACLHVSAPAKASNRTEACLATPTLCEWHTMQTDCQTRR
jgi:hypothetical protein